MSKQGQSRTTDICPADRSLGFRVGFPLRRPPRHAALEGLNHQLKPWFSSSAPTKGIPLADSKETAKTKPQLQSLLRTLLWLLAAHRRKSECSRSSAPKPAVAQSHLASPHFATSALLRPCSPTHLSLHVSHRPASSGSSLRPQHPAQAGKRSKLTHIHSCAAPVLLPRGPQSPRSLTQRQELAPQPACDAFTLRLSCLQQAAGSLV